jgi:hypothetical protein
MISIRPIALALFSSALAACGGGAAATQQTETTPAADTTPSPEPTAEEPASSGESAAPEAGPPRIRVLHATSDEAASDVTVGLDSDEPVITSLTYAHGSGYVAVDSGRHSIVVHGPATESHTPVLGLASDDLEPEHAYTLFFVTQGAADAPFALYTGDDDDHPGEDVAALRFFHAMIGVDDVDVCLPGATARAAGEPLFADVSPNSLGTSQGIRYADIPAGESVALQVRAHSSPPCAGRMVGTGHFTPTAGTSYTAVAIGRTTGHPHAALQLLVCSDAPADGTCDTVAMPAR